MPEKVLLLFLKNVAVSNFFLSGFCWRLFKWWRRSQTHSSNLAFGSFSGIFLRLTSVTISTKSHDTCWGGVKKWISSYIFLITSLSSECSWKDNKSKNLRGWGIFFFFFLSMTWHPLILDCRVFLLMTSHLMTMTVRKWPKMMEVSFSTKRISSWRFSQTIFILRSRSCTFFPAIRSSWNRESDHKTVFIGKFQCFRRCWIRY